jgi:hypothetical protein
MFLGLVNCIMIFLSKKEKRLKQISLLLVAKLEYLLLYDTHQSIFQKYQKNVIHIIHREKMFLMTQKA